jgi:hypothetical protein
MPAVWLRIVSDLHANLQTKLHYYRCIGSDGYRRLKGPVCTNRPVRQDSLDRFVWDEMIRLLDDPVLVQAEIERRREWKGQQYRAVIVNYADDFVILSRGHAEEAREWT